MSQQVTIAGAPVQVQTVYRRELDGGGGPALLEVELAVIVRGRLPNRHFIELTRAEPLRLGLPATGGELVVLGTITGHQQMSSGSGEAAMYRHDLVVRELPESAARRAAERAAAGARAAAEGPAPAPPTRPVRSAPAEPDEATAPEPTVAVRSDASVWGAAIQQMRSPETPRAKAPEEPLTFGEMAGVEAVLVNLRVEALIEQLRAAGLVSRTAVDHSFQRLIRDRFVRDATPVVGEHAAKRAGRQLSGE